MISSRLHTNLIDISKEDLKNNHNADRPIHTCTQFKDYLDSQMKHSVWVIFEFQQDVNVLSITSYKSIV